MRAADRGSATILGVALCAALLSSGVLGLAVVQAAVVTSRAQAAADLAALAGSQSAETCEASAGVARANGASMTTCRAEGSDVLVEVTMPAPPLVQKIALAIGHPSGVIAARARAGF